MSQRKQGVFQKFDREFWENKRYELGGDIRRKCLECTELQNISVKIYILNIDDLYKIIKMKDQFVDEVREFVKSQATTLSNKRSDIRSFPDKFSLLIEYVHEMELSKLESMPEWECVCNELCCFDLRE